MKYALVNGIILDGNLDMEPVEQTILIDNDKINAIIDKKWGYFRL